MTMQEAGWTVLAFSPAVAVALAEMNGATELAAALAAVYCVLAVVGTFGIFWAACRRPAPTPVLELHPPRRVRAATPAGIPDGQYGPGDWPETVYAGRAHVSGCPIEPGPAFRMLPDTETGLARREETAPVRIETVETAVREILELARTGDMDPETAAGELYAAGRLTIATGIDALGRIEAHADTLGDGVDAALYIADDVGQVLGDLGETAAADGVYALGVMLEGIIQDARTNAGADR